MKIIFVCTGNTCRSPMAETLAKKIFTDENIDAQVTSAGIAAFEGCCATINAVKALKNVGLNIENHRSKQLTSQMVSSTDLILTMTKGHAEQIVSMYDGALEKTYTMGKFVGDENLNIPDPYAQDLHVYIALRDILTGLIKKIARCLRDSHR